MRKLRLFSVVLVLLSSFSLYAAERPFADPSTATPRMVPLDGTILGKEADILIELRERPLLDRRGDRLNSQASEESLDALLDRLEADLRPIEQARSEAGTNSASAAETPRLKFRYKLTFAGASARVSRQAVSAIRALPYVKAVHLDREMSAHLAKSVAAIRAPEVWESLGVRGKGVVVAVIDTGIDYLHPALGKVFPGSKVAGGYDFVNLDDDPMDDNGHGTHVAGIIAGNVAPVIGVAPEATLLAYKVLDDEGNGQASAIIAAIERAMDPDGNGDLSDHADVVNISIGGPRSVDDPLVAAVERAVAAGMVFCLSAGNSFENAAIGSPALAPSAITVAALDPRDRRAPFSSRGPVGGTWETKPEIGAPGVSIVSAKRGGGTIAASGTSMAAPHIAGVAALILEKHPDWTPADVKAAIVSTARPAYTTESEPRPSVLAAGGGRVDARAAIDAKILASPAALSFGVPPKFGEAWTATRTIRLRNAGGAAETVTVTPPVLSDGMTLTITPGTVTLAPGGTEDVVFTLELPARTPGPNDDNAAYAGQVELQAAGGPLHMPWQVVNGSTLNLTLGGTDETSLAITTRGSQPVMWPEGPRTVGALVTHATPEVAVAAFFQPASGLGRLVVLEEQQIIGHTKLTASPEQAIHRVEIAGADENGVPFAALIGTEGVDSVITREFFLWSFQLMDFSVFDSQTREFMVSPLKHTGLRLMEMVRKPGAVYSTMYRILRSIEKDEVLQTLPRDWASQTIEYDCLKPTCDAYIAQGAGSLGLFWAHSVGKGGSKWKLFLTPRVAEEWDFRAYLLVREETSPVNYSNGVQPWTYLSPAMRNDGGRVAAAPFGRKTVVDYFSPSPEQPLLIGDGPVVLRTILGTRKIDFEPYGAAIGESIGERISAVKLKLFDEAGEELFLSPRSQASYRGPQENGVYRLLMTTDYTVAGHEGKLTQTSMYDKSKSFSPPTLTMMRVEDGGDRTTWSVAAGTAATLTFAGRHSTFMDNDFYMFHRNIDEAATRAWWRRHGTEEWIALPISKKESDYSIRGTMPGTAGTIYSGDLGAAVAVPGPIDLKLLVTSVFGGTTEAVYEPALIVREAQAKRRAVR